MIANIFSFICGGTFGLIIASLMVAAKEADREYENSNEINIKKDKTDISEK